MSRKDRYDCQAFADLPNLGDPKSSDWLVDVGGPRRMPHSSPCTSPAGTAGSKTAIHSLRLRHPDISTQNSVQWRIDRMSSLSLRLGSSSTLSPEYGTLSSAMKRQLAIYASALLLAGCATRPADIWERPFEVTLGKGAHWTEGHEAFDSKLPGYHITGGIASITLEPRSDIVPRLLTLVIRTTGDEPMLEHFEVKIDDRKFQTSLHGREGPTRILNEKGELLVTVQRGTYVRFSARDDAVHVTFTEGARPYLREKTTISWIDWYR